MSRSTVTSLQELCRITRKEYCREKRDRDNNFNLLFIYTKAFKRAASSVLGKKQPLRFIIVMTNTTPAQRKQRQHTFSQHTIRNTISGWKRPFLVVPTPLGAAPSLPMSISSPNHERRHIGHQRHRYDTAMPISLIIMLGSLDDISHSVVHTHGGHGNEQQRDDTRVQLTMLLLDLLKDLITIQSLRTVWVGFSVRSFVRASERSIWSSEPVLHRLLHK